MSDEQFHPTQRRKSGRAGNSRPSRNPRITQYLRQRRLFTMKAVLVAALFLGLTFAQWILLIYVDALKRVFNATYFISMALVLIALLLVLAFVFVGKMRFRTPCNLIAGIFIVEFVTWGLAVVIAKIRPDNVHTVWMCALITLGVFAVFHIIGLCLPRDLTLNVVLLFVCSTVFFAGSYLFLLIAIFHGSLWAFLFFNLLLKAMILMFIMYHAQTIHGKRYAEMRLTDNILASLIMFFNFIILYMLILLAVLSLQVIRQGIDTAKSNKAGKIDSNESPPTESTTAAPITTTTPMVNTTVPANVTGTANVTGPANVTGTANVTGAVNATGSPISTLFTMPTDDIIVNITSTAYITKTTRTGLNAAVTKRRKYWKYYI